MDDSVLVRFHFKGDVTHHLGGVPLVGIGDDEGGGVGARLAVSMLVEGQARVGAFDGRAAVGLHILGDELLANHPDVHVIVRRYLVFHFLWLEHQVGFVDAEGGGGLRTDVHGGKGKLVLHVGDANQVFVRFAFH